MVGTIKAYTHWKGNTHYYKYFEVIDELTFEELKKEFEVSSSKIDTSSNNSEVFDYDYYEYSYIDEDGEECIRYIAVCNGSFM